MQLNEGPGTAYDLVVYRLARRRTAVERKCRKGFAKAGSFLYIKVQQASWRIVYFLSGTRRNMIFRI